MVDALDACLMVHGSRLMAKGGQGRMKAGLKGVPPPKPPFRKLDFQKTCVLNQSGGRFVLDVRFCPETAFSKIRFPKNMYVE
jgi:hypothetical protein